MIKTNNLGSGLWKTKECVGMYSSRGPRANNEDACDFLIAPDGSAILAVLADGMGGHAKGEVASGLIVQVLTEVFRQNGFSQPSETLNWAINRAHEVVRERAASNPACRGMGSTVVAAVIASGVLHVGHVGDSRAMQFAGGHVRRLTKDQLVVVDELGVPENLAKHHPRGNELTQAVGVDVGPLRVQVQTYDFADGDHVVLCSDGVSEYVTEPTLARMLSEKTPLRAAEAIVRAALDAGTKDNSTAVVVRSPR